MVSRRLTAHERVTRRYASEWWVTRHSALRNCVNASGGANPLYGGGAANKKTRRGFPAGYSS
jgi:hypothetical protein